MYLLKMQGTDPCRNLAVEEHLLRTRTAGDYLLLWQNANTIVLGRHQNTLAEINADFVAAKGITVVRRITGGGAVYHDGGNLNFSYITNAEKGTSSAMERFTRPVVAALNSLGLPAVISGRNDITINGQKVSGNAQAVHGQRILHHGTLLFHADLSVLGQALRVHPGKLQAKGVASVRARVVNIADLLPAPMSMEAFTGHILRAFAQEAECQPVVFSGDDMRAIEELRAGKYTSWEWNYGTSPDFAIRSQKKFDGGLLEACIDAHKGHIARCAFYGDFMALRPAEEVAKALRGCRYERATVEAALAALPLEDYFGVITREELLSCLFDTDG